MNTLQQNTLLESLQWRYATKQFDASRRVDDATVEQLQRAVNLTATSYGLQPFRVILVTDPELKERLKDAAYGQSQLTDASHVFVFAHKLDISEAYVDDYMERIAAARDIDVTKLQGFGDTIKGSIEGKSDADLIDWNRRQAYIALGHLLVAAAELRVDACPMEGFEADKVNEILGLSELGLGVSVIATVGYRSVEDSLQYKAKVRLPLEELFIRR